MMSYSNWEWLYQDGVPVIYAEYRGIPVAFASEVDHYIAYITHGNEIKGPFYNTNLNLLQLNVRLHIDQEVLFTPEETWAEMGKQWLDEYFRRGQDYLDALIFSPTVKDYLDKVRTFPPMQSQIPDWWLVDDLASKTPWNISTFDTRLRPRNVDEFLASLGLQ